MTAEDCYYDDEDEGSNGEMPEMRSRVVQEDTRPPESLPELQTDSMGPAESMGEQGFVYFIKTEDEQFIKIGFSKQPMNRAGKFGTLMPIRLIGYFPGSRATERWLHTKFAHAHRVGEWFENTDALREFIGMLGLIEPLPEKRRKIRVKRIRLEPETKPQLEIDGKSPKSVREYLAEIGSRGGKAKVPKGIASLTPKERKERAKQAAAARWGTKTKATKKAKKKK